VVAPTLSGKRVRESSRARGSNFYPVCHRTLDNYWIQKKLGRGKYSEVYEATNANNDEKCVVKVLKPIKKRKIKKEVKVLLNLVGAPNTVRLLDMVRDKATKIPCLVFNFINATSWKDIDWKPRDVQKYMYELLRCLDLPTVSGSCTATSSPTTS